MSRMSYKSPKSYPREKHSLLRRFTLWSLSAMVIFTLLLIGVFASLFISFRSASYRTVQDSLRFYDERISAELDSDIATLMENCTFNPDIVRIRTTKDRNEEVNSIVRVKNLLSSQIQLNSVIRGYYLYYPEKKVFLPAYNTGAFDPRKGPLFPSFIRTLLDEGLKDGRFPAALPGNWFYVDGDGRGCLLRVFRSGGIYGGAWIDLDNLPGFSEFSGTEAIQLITDESGSVLYAGASPQTKSFQEEYLNGLSIPVRGSLEKPVFVRIPGAGRRVAVSFRQSFSDYCFTILLPQAEFVKMLRPLMLLIVLLMLWTVLFFVAFSRMGRRVLAVPTESLMTVTEKIHRGELESRIVPPNDYAETVRLVEAFNRLISEIAALRISVYEEQIAAREFELKALKNQVAPHFLINCLNTIFMSAQNPARVEMTSQIITTLSSHLRYTMSEQSIVPLSEELEYLENYILLTQYRFPDTLSFELQAGDEVMNASVFPLILLTLTENSVKTGLIMGDPFLIRVQAGIVEKDGERFVRLVHTDSGTGLSEEKLEKYNHIFEHPEVTEKGTGIGLYNTALRLRLILGERAEMKFRNEEGMGLSVELCFPYIEYKEAQEQDAVINSMMEKKDESADH